MDVLDRPVFSCGQLCFPIHRSQSKVRNHKRSRDLNKAMKEVHIHLANLLQLYKFFVLHINLFFFFVCYLLSKPRNDNNEVTGVKNNALIGK